jgi:hypothetical protein
VLTEAQVVALEKAKTEEAHGEFEASIPAIAAPRTRSMSATSRVLGASISRPHRQLLRRRISLMIGSFRSSRAKR